MIAVAHTHVQMPSDAVVEACGGAVGSSIALAVTYPLLIVSCVLLVVHLVVSKLHNTPLCFEKGTAWFWLALVCHEALLAGQQAAFTGSVFTGTPPVRK